jgi:hypothetical protein
MKAFWGGIRYKLAKSIIIIPSIGSRHYLGVNASFGKSRSSSCTSSVNGRGLPYGRWLICGAILGSTIGQARSQEQEEHGNQEDDEGGFVMFEEISDSIPASTPTAPTNNQAKVVNLEQVNSRQAHKFAVVSDQKIIYPFGTGNVKEEKSFRCWRNRRQDG